MAAALKAVGLKPQLHLHAETSRVAPDRHGKFAEFGDALTFETASVRAAFDLGSCALRLSLQRQIYSYDRLAARVDPIVVVGVPAAPLS